MLPLCILVSAFSLVLRYRRSGREVREQIKWLAFAASFVGLVYFGTLISGLLLSPESYTTNETPPLWISLSQLLTQLSFASVPTAIGFAVLKYRLYDIEIIINRALVYGLLTAILAGVYFGGVTATQALLRTLTDQEKLPQLVVVASTLVIAAMFTPLRRRIQSFIDRSFYRRKYDARKTLEGFSSKLRDETDLEALRGDLVGVVRETMQPAHVSLWLRPETTPKREQA
jgi:cytochrome bd-type quinol oxidase subunit 2